MDNNVCGYETEMTGEEAYAYFLRIVNAAHATNVAPVRHER